VTFSLVIKCQDSFVREGLSNIKVYNLYSLCNCNSYRPSRSISLRSTIPTLVKFGCTYRCIIRGFENFGCNSTLNGKNANVFHRFTPRFVVAEASG